MYMYGNDGQRALHQSLRGHFQTTLGKINVIVTLTFDPPPLLIFNVTGKSSLNCGSDRVAAVANGRK